VHKERRLITTEVSSRLSITGIEFETTAAPLLFRLVPTTELDIFFSIPIAADLCIQTMKRKQQYVRMRLNQYNRE
jgi:hypothetical protein